MPSSLEDLDSKLKDAYRRLHAEVVAYSGKTLTWDESRQNAAKEAAIVKEIKRLEAEIERLSTPVHT